MTSKGQQVLCTSTMTWSATTVTGFGSFKFASDSTPTTSHFAQPAQVKDGVFSGNA